MCSFKKKQVEKEDSYCMPVGEESLFVQNILETQFRKKSSLGKYYAFNIAKSSV